MGDPNSLKNFQKEVIGRTPWHILRMSRYCELIRLASTMHDIGKIGTPDEIVFKPGGLTP